MTRQKVLGILELTPGTHEANGYSDGLNKMVCLSLTRFFANRGLGDGLIHRHQVGSAKLILFLIESKSRSMVKVKAI